MNTIKSRKRFQENAGSLLSTFMKVERWPLGEQASGADVLVSVLYRPHTSRLSGRLGDLLLVFVGLPVTDFYLSADILPSPVTPMPQSLDDQESVVLPHPCPRQAASIPVPVLQTEQPSHFSIVAAPKLPSESSPVLELDPNSCSWRHLRSWMPSKAQGDPGIKPLRRTFLHMTKSKARINSLDTSSSQERTGEEHVCVCMCVWHHYYQQAGFLAALKMVHKTSASYPP